jgi:hypothetical protein
MLSLCLPPHPHNELTLIRAVFLHAVGRVLLGSPLPSRWLLNIDELEVAHEIGPYRKSSVPSRLMVYLAPVHPLGGDALLLFDAEACQSRKGGVGRILGR